MIGQRQLRQIGLWIEYKMDAFILILQAVERPIYNACTRVIGYFK